MMTHHSTTIRHRVREWLLDRAEDFCALIDYTIVFPVDALRDWRNQRRMLRVRRSYRWQLRRADPMSHRERARLLTAWAALEDGITAHIAAGGSSIPPAPSPVGDVLRALCTVETARAQAGPVRFPRRRPVGSSALERSGGELLDTLAMHTDPDIRRFATIELYYLARRLYDDQAAEPVTVLHSS